jgi:hypothetical protein
MDCFGKNACNLLRQGAMLRRCSPAKRFFQFIRHICTNEHSFSINHLFVGSLVKRIAKVNEGRFHLSDCEAPPQ